MTFSNFFWALNIAFIAPFLFGFVTLSLYQFMRNLW